MLTSHVDIAFHRMFTRSKLKSGIVLMPLIGWDYEIQNRKGSCCLALVGGMVVALICPA